MNKCYADSLLKKSIMAGQLTRVSTNHLANDVPEMYKCQYIAVCK